MWQLSFFGMGGRVSLCAGVMWDKGAVDDFRMCEGEREDASAVVGVVP